MRPIGYVALLCAALVGPGCIPVDIAGPDPVQFEAGIGEPVELTRLRAEPYSFAYFSGMEEAARLVLRSDEEWAATWSAIWQRHTPTPDHPQIDFSDKVLIVAALGLRYSGGYSIYVERAYQRDGRVEVLIRSVSPAPTCGTTAALTQPVDIALMPRTEQPIVFIEHAEVLDCGG
jgi:hypothetical protein